MSEPPKSAKDYADRFRAKNGVVDFYKFLGLERNATQDEIIDACIAIANPAGNAADAYWRITMSRVAAKHLTTPEARAAYDKTLTPSWLRLLIRANTRFKRLSLLAFPFFVVVTLYWFSQDNDYSGWEPSLSFFIFLMASILCLLVAFTSLGDWIKGDNQ